jgi:hypothetical protein
MRDVCMVRRELTRVLFILKSCCGIALSCIDAPGVDRNRLHEYIGSTALKFFDANLNVRHDSAN